MSLKPTDSEINDKIQNTKQEIKEEYQQKYGEKPPENQKELTKLGRNTKNWQNLKEVQTEINGFYHQLLDADKPKNVKIKTKRKPYSEIATGALTTSLTLQITELEPALATGTLTALAAHALYKDQERNPSYNPITRNISITDTKDVETYEHLAAEQYHAFQQHNGSPTFGDPILQEGTEMLARTYALRNKANQKPSFEKYVDAVGHGIYQSASKAIEQLDKGEKPSKQALRYHLPATIIDQDSTTLKEVFQEGKTAVETDIEAYESHLDSAWNLKMNHLYSKL